MYVFGLESRRSVFALAPCFASFVRRILRQDPPLLLQVLQGSSCRLGVIPFDGLSSKEQQMSANIYVGNLTFNVGNDELRSLFVPYGEVSSANVITDRDSGRSRGFGFVEMASKEAADSAISALNGKDHGGRQLTVNIAKPRSR